MGDSDYFDEEDSSVYDNLRGLSGFGCKMYRPEGWENPYTYERCKQTCKVCDTEDVCRVAYETGADDMLKALCTDENRLNCIDQFGVEPPKDIKGWLIFIPDEEE